MSQTAEAATSGKAARIFGLDLFKAILISLVVLGHVLLGKIGETPLRAAIYSFHMPLFMLLSGYFTSAVTLRKRPFVQFSRERAIRVLYPWLIAWGVFYLMRPSVAGVLDSFIHPWRHLWFGPVIFIYWIIAWVLSRVDRTNLVVLILGIASFLVASKQIDALAPLFAKRIAHPETEFYFLGDRRLYTMFSFFSVGYLARVHLSSVERLFSSSVLRLCLLIAWLASLLIFWTDFPFPSLARPAVNVVVGLCLLVEFNQHKYSALGKSRWVQFAAQQSYAIYLWHILPQNRAVRVASGSSAKYYVLCTAGLALMVAAIWLVQNKVPFLCKPLGIVAAPRSAAPKS